MNNQITLVKWKQLDQFPNYYISNNGLARVGKSLMIPKVGRYGYLYIVVYNRELKLRHRHHIHRLVWDYFGPEPHKPGYEVHHMDENHNNNHIGNLELIPMEVHRRLHSEARKQSKAA